MTAEYSLGTRRARRRAGRPNQAKVTLTYLHDAQVHGAGTMGLDQSHEKRVTIRHVELVVDGLG